VASIKKRKVAGKLTTNYYIKYKDEHGKWKVVVGTADKESTRRLAAKYEADATLRRNGLVVDSDLASTLPLHAFRTHLEAQGDTESHVSLTLNQIEAISKACGFAKLNDLRKPDAADKVYHFLENKRTESKRKPLKSEVKRRRTIKREPEKLEPISARTKNSYIASLKNFCKWCVTTGKMPDCSLLHLKRAKATAEPIRRAATDSEVKRLLRATKNGGECYGLSPLDRYYLYRAALATGFRASELASLYPVSFRLRGNLPHILLTAGNAKNDKAAEQPIRREFAGELARWLRGRPSGPVWPGLWHKKAAAMLRTDLAAAGVKYCDNTGRVLDFHALRVTFITSLARAGVHPKKAQVLARHGDINLTMKYYTHLSLEEVSAVLPPVAM
jgi:integrase